VKNGAATAPFFLLQFSVDTGKTSLKTKNTILFVHTKHAVQRPTKPYEIQKKYTHVHLIHFCYSNPINIYINNIQCLN
jgi:hypothetical protein